MKGYGVGLIGVEPNRSWAARAHIPAIAALHGRFHLAGIANSNFDSSRKAAESLEISKAFNSVDELVTSPDVDVVAVTVKVPSHFELVSKALSAGKHVYCEWPLGKDLDEAVRLDQLARDAGVHAIIGTQALRAPAIQYMKQLVSEGYVGEVLSVTLVGNGGLGGAEVDLANAYTLDAITGASLLTIPFGHTLAALQDIFGELAGVHARLETRRSTVKIIETGKTQTATAPDDVIVTGVFPGGTTFSAHYRGGKSLGTGLLLEIVGTAGALQLTGPLGHVQLVPLSLQGSQTASVPLTPLDIPGSFSSNPDAKGPASNVAALYADLYDDLTKGTNRAPSFASAVRVHRTLDRIQQSAKLV